MGRFAVESLSGNSVFPYIFSFGKGLRKTGSIPMTDMRHMELQWTG